MTPEERFKISSSEYMDLIIDYNRNLAYLNQFAEFSPQIMNDRFAIIYVPRARITPRSFSEFNYFAFPVCFAPNSEQSLDASGVIRIRRFPAFNLRGQGVLIGIIDSGIDYTNPVFRYEDGSSRIVSIWDQSIDSEDRYPEGFLYGTEFLREEINQALESYDPLSIVPSRDEIGHGTMMAGVAAGREVPREDFYGVVPEAELVIVKLKEAKQVVRDIFLVPSGVTAYQENDIMWAIQYIIETARELGRPVAVCIGLGSSQDSHDGRGSLNSQLSVGADFPGVIITVSAGNEGNKRRHFFSNIEPSNGSKEMDLNIGEGEAGFSLEIWGAAPNTYSVELVSPGGERIPRIPEGLEVSRTINFAFEETILYIDYRMVETQSGDQLILMRFVKPAPGIWSIIVHGRGDLQSSFHAWLPANNFISNNTYFIQSNPFTTITAPGLATVPITVTAYNPANNNLYQAASKGYSRLGFIKPDFAAPGVNIVSPDINQGFITVSGTSVAAAHTAGVTAMVLEWGIVKGFYKGLDTIGVKKFLIRGARRSGAIIYPNRDWGYGILDIYNVFNQLRADI